MLSGTRAPRVPFRRRATDPAGCRARSGKRRAATAAVGRRRERGPPISGAAGAKIGACSLAWHHGGSRKVAFSLNARGRSLSRSGHRCPRPPLVAAQGARQLHARFRLTRKPLAAAFARRPIQPSLGSRVSLPRCAAKRQPHPADCGASIPPRAPRPATRRADRAAQSCVERGAKYLNRWGRPAT
jgi:hypothetical protein